MTSPVHQVETAREPKRDLIAEVRNVGLVGNPQSRRGAEPSPEVEKKSVSSVPSVVNPIISSYAYTNDGLGRRAQIAQSGAAFEILSFPRQVGVSYNERGEVVGADYVSQSAPAKGAASYRYQYDAIGNRQRHSRQAPDAAKPEITTYEANALNQYQSVQSGPSKEHPTHDLDGNLLENAEFRFEWDSENRLIAAEKKDRTLRVTYVYDSQSRLVARRAQVPARDDTRTWDPAQESHYLYDGWNRLAELTLDPRGEKATNGAIHTNEPLKENGAVAPPSSFRLQPSTFLTWGRDLSGRLQGAGGVGGLLAATEVKPAPAQSASKESPSQSSLARSHYFLYDANGNVTQIVDAAGRLAAHYEYDPFGNVTKTGGGELALSNPWRFSTKAQDEVTGWNYYGFRHYRPEMGRWLSRDPIGERGGMHVYGFVKNDPLNRWDKLGLLDERTEGHIAKLHPKLQPLARSHITTVNGNMKREARKRGQAVVYLAKIIQSHRTYAEQDALYNQGRNGNPGPRVTNARGGFSNHNFKLAYDIAFFCGTEVKWDGWEYDVAGRIGKAFGLVWGGDWKSIVDKPHFEYPHGLTMEELREQSNGGRDDVDVPENPANPICCSPR